MYSRCGRLLIESPFISFYSIPYAFYGKPGDYTISIGKPLKGALLSLTRQVFFVIPLILVLPLIFGIDGVLYAGPVADGGAFLLLFPHRSIFKPCLRVIR